jgi:ATP-binding cassette, subfamily B, bacterial MsbA
MRFTKYSLGNNVRGFFSGIHNFYQNAKSGVALRFISLYLAPCKKYLVSAMTLMGVGAVASGAISYLIKPVIELLIAKQLHQIAIFSGYIVILFLTRSVTNYCQKIILSFVEAKTVAQIQKDLFKKLIYMDIHDFNTTSTGQVISYFINDIYIIRSAITAIVINLGRELLTILCLIGVMFYQNWRMSCLIFIFFPIAFIHIVAISRKLHRLIAKNQNQQEKLTSYISNTIHNIKAIKSFNGEDMEITRFNKFANHAFKISYVTARRAAFAAPIMETFCCIALVSTLLYGANQIIDLQIQPGQLTSFLFALLFIYRPIRASIDSNQILQGALVSIKRIFALLDMKDERAKNRKTVKKIDMQSTQIVFRNVDFYAEDSGQKILNHLNLIIQPRQKIGLVGSSGGGKSTIGNLLLRFYEPNSGEILINDCDIRHIDLRYLRQNIAYVGQDSFLFDASIRYNISYNIPNVTDERIAEVIDLANAHFIYKLPNGINTRITTHATLSGGQKQLLFIIRAMLKDSPILILDEATSALDNKLEKEVRKALEVASHNKTVIIIAHRLSTVVNCDQIHVISNGTIVESGKHKELIAKKDGIYYNLFRAQVL